MDAQALGRYLRQAREARDLTLDDAERTLRIRAHILERFEFGDFALPAFSPLQVRGFLRIYAGYLGLEEDRVMQYYEAALTGKPERRSLIGGVGRKPGRKTGRKNKRDTDSVPAAPPASPTIPARGRMPSRPVDPPRAADAGYGYTSPYTPGAYNAGQPAVREPAPAARREGGGVLSVITRLLVAGAALAVIAFVLVQMIGLPAATDDPVMDGVLGQLPSTLTPSPSIPTFTPRPATQIALLPNASTYSGTGLQVIIELEQRSWLTVTTDGQPSFTGIAVPGDRLEYLATGEIVLTAANAEALAVTFNGQPQPSLGMRGQRVDVTFRIGGLTVQTGPGFDPTPITSATPLPTPTDSGGAILAQLTPPTPIPVEPPPTVDPAVQTDLAASAAALPTDAEPPASADFIEAVVPTSDFVPVTVTPSPAAAQATLPPPAAPAITAMPSPTPLSIIPTTTGGPATALPTTEPASPPPSPTNSEIAPDFAATATALNGAPGEQAAPVNTAVPTADPGMLIAPTATFTFTPLPTATPTASLTPSRTPSLTPSLTPTRTLTPSRTPSPTATPFPAGMLPPRQPRIEPTPTKTAP